MSRGSTRMVSLSGLMIIFPTRAISMFGSRIAMQVKMARPVSLPMAVKWVYDNTYQFRYGSTSFTSLLEWSANNIEQERTNNKRVYLNIDPLFNNTSFDNTGKQALQLQKKSSLRKKKFLLPAYFSITDDATDIGGKTLPGNKKIFPGAYIK